jgi:hypothetical protein
VPASSDLPPFYFYDEEIKKREKGFPKMADIDTSNFNWDSYPYFTWDDYTSVKAGYIALLAGQRITTVLIGKTTLQFDHRAANIKELGEAVDKIYAHLQSRSGRRRFIQTNSSKGLF